uniref:RRM domain-containing protein n=1 Tax=Strongyloides venezuelensis TaxID=75913 RepID=A0A0K0G0C5_STRVS
MFSGSKRCEYFIFIFLAYSLDLNENPVTRFEWIFNSYTDLSSLKTIMGSQGRNNQMSGGRGRGNSRGGFRGGNDSGFGGRGGFNKSPRGFSGDRGGMRSRGGDRGGFRGRDNSRGGFRGRDNGGGFRGRDNSRGGFRGRDNGGGFRGRDNSRGGFRGRDNNRGGFRGRDNSRGGFGSRDNNNSGRGGKFGGDNRKRKFQKKDDDFKVVDNEYDPTNNKSDSEDEIETPAKFAKVQNQSSKPVKVAKKPEPKKDEKKKKEVVISFEDNEYEMMDSDDEHLNDLDEEQDEEDEEIIEDEEMVDEELLVDEEVSDEELLVDEEISDEELEDEEDDEVPQVTSKNAKTEAEVQPQNGKAKVVKEDSSDEELAPVKKLSVPESKSLSNLEELLKEDEERRKEREQCTLRIKTLPLDTTVEDMKKLAPSAVAVRFTRSKKKCGCYLVFKSEALCKKALKELSTKEFKGSKLDPKWMGIRDVEAQNKLAKQPINPLELYVGGIANFTPRSALEKAFPDGKVCIQFDPRGQQKNFCFVKFTDEKAAYKAFKENSSLIIHNQLVDVFYGRTWSIPTKLQEVAEKDDAEVAEKKGEPNVSTKKSEAEFPRLRKDSDTSSIESIASSGEGIVELEDEEGEDEEMLDEEMMLDEEIYIESSDEEAEEEPEDEE